MAFHMGAAPTNGGDVKTETGVPENDKLPKRRIAIQVAYCGSGYYGLQYNVKTEEKLPTVEGELFRALKKTKLVPEDIMEEPKKIAYNSASRTDKNVSALGQVLSFKIRYTDDLEYRLNEQLPEHIKILNVVRTTKNFIAKNKSDYRTYSYTMPSFALKSYKEIIDPIKQKVKSAARLDPLAHYDRQLEIVKDQTIFETDMEKLKEYRASEIDIKRLDNILKRYVGTHSFHNFTSGVKKGEASAKRIIKQCYVSRQGMPIHEGFEWLEIKIIGQSFMIHQIRKMIGLALSMMAGWTKEDHWGRAFSERYEDIPRAPADGLLLNSVHYDAYNKWLANGSGNAGILATPIDWDFPIMKEDMQNFKDKHIMPLMVKNMLSQEEGCGFVSWLEQLKSHCYTGIRARQQAQENGQTLDDSDDEVPKKKSKKEESD